MFLDTRLMIVGVYVRDLRQGTLGEVFVQLDLLNGSLPIWVRVGGPSNVSFCNNFHFFQISWRQLPHQIWYWGSDDSAVVLQQWLPLVQAPLATRPTATTHGSHHWKIVFKIKAFKTCLRENNFPLLDLSGHHGNRVINKTFHPPIHLF